MLAEGVRSIYASGECEIDLARRELRVQGAAVPIGGRAFEIIEVLAQSAGQLVTKDELMHRVWPGAIVNDNALQVHISAVRKALGSYRAMLKTESGRGYRLLGDWSIRHYRPTAPSIITFPQSRGAVPSPPLREAKEAPAGNLPALITDLIGRSAALPLIRELLSAYRLVTLTGAGGIGKSTLAIHAARDLLPEFTDGGWLVELASLSDPSLVPSAVTGVLGLNLGGGDVSAVAIARAISDRNLLLIIDNCEHVIDAAAGLAEALLNLCPRVTILATSREVLRISGESVYRVSPLDVPAAEEYEPDQILDRSAVELFLTRTKQAGFDSDLRTEELPSIAAICRRLDGIPLAIEFAAACAAILGVGRVAAGLQNHLALLTSHRRTALPRHQTLRATLDWSHELLSQTERQLLRRLGVFSGGFTLAGAEAVMRDTEPQAVLDSLANLVNKSLVTADRSVPIGRWRLLETTRAYALEKLRESGETKMTARHHAEFHLALFAPFAAEDELQAAVGGLDRYRREADNLRAALNWAFSGDGDAGLGVEIAAAAVDFWGALSLLAEACEWADKALANIGGAAGTRSEMVLQCSLGLALIYTQGMLPPAREALMRSLALARELDDFEYQQRATHDLWLFWARLGASNNALAVALQYEEIVRFHDVQSRAVADWIIGIPQTYLAAHIEASERLQRAIDTYPIERRERDLIRLGADLRASASSHLTVNLLSRGLLDAASLAALSAIEEARVANQPVILCIALSWAAGFIFLSRGDLDMAKRCGDELVDQAYKHSLRPFHATGLCIRGSLAARHADPEAGIGPLRYGLADMKETSYLLFYPFFRIELASVLGSIGRIDDGLAEVDEAMRVAMEIDYRWFVPEILRAKGELLALSGSDDVAAIEDLFRQSMSQARGQQAIYWELCAAASLAGLMRRQQKEAEARSILAPIYDQLTEGFSASRVKQAKALLDQLSNSGCRSPESC